MNQPIQDPMNARAKALDSMGRANGASSTETQVYYMAESLVSAILYVGDAILHAANTQRLLAFSQKKAAMKVKVVEK